ncbi:hypothetical protein JTE90_001931 [Oedothorax gibbosus]|uniref:Uncharacterized protein n=1 Tax=Oedothorax gibbosus TaxID=931172 RepID=A0AAV6VTT8_9ARAC|nr:hypothetical protein JTE90_001931 [Oedothorax gibbosus]
MNPAELSPRRRRRRFLVGYGEGEVTVKREPADEDIKDYAETTMNELLGWYGYEKVDSRDTQGLNLTHFASTHPNNANKNHPPSSEDNPSPPSSAMDGSDVSEDGRTSPHTSDRIRPDSVSPGPDAYPSESLKKESKWLADFSASVDSSLLTCETKVECKIPTLMIRWTKVAGGNFKNKLRENADSGPVEVRGAAPPPEVAVTSPEGAWRMLRNRKGRGG